MSQQGKVRDIALFLGSFNPPHIGHTLAAAYTLAVLNPDEIWVIPCWKHAFGKDLAPFHDRMEMTRQAMAIFDPSRVKVLGIEELLTTKYTVYLLKHFRKKHPREATRDVYGTEFHLVVGGDILGETDKWHKWDEITQLVNIFPVGRGGSATGPRKVKMPTVSSTQIRRWLARGWFDRIEGWVPDQVLDYLRRGMYR